MLNLVMVKNECTQLVVCISLLTHGLIYVSLQIRLVFLYTLPYLKQFLPLK